MLFYQMGPLGFDCDGFCINNILSVQHLHSKLIYRPFNQINCRNVIDVSRHEPDETPSLEECVKLLLELRVFIVL